MGYWDRMKNRHEYQLDLNSKTLEEKTVVLKQEQLLVDCRIAVQEVSKDQPLCFAHVPTYAGGIMKAVACAKPTTNYHHHAMAPMYGNIFCNKNKTRRHSYRPFFSIIGNPFEWLIRLWFYNWPYGKEAVGSEQLRIQPRMIWDDLETFLYEFNSRSDVGISSEWNELNAHEYPMSSFRYLQTCQTFDKLTDPDLPGGRGKKFSRAIFYGRYEMLPQVLDILHLPRKVMNQEQREYGDYRQYYDTKLIDHITAWRWQELNLLGYDFEGPTDEIPLFKITQPFMWPTI